MHRILLALGLLLLALVGTAQRAGTLRHPFAGSMPQPPGNLLAQLADGVRVPDAVLDSDWTGRMVFRFTVQTDSSLTDFDVLRSSGGTPYDNEVIRGLRQTRGWIPATRQERPVAARFDLPVLFCFR